RHDATERLNGSVGASLVLRNLELEGVLISPYPSSRRRPGPITTGGHWVRRNYQRRFDREITRYGSRRLPGRHGERSAERHVDCRFRQLRIEAALVELGDQGTLELVALVEEGDAEREADIGEDVGILGPGDHRARAHHRRQIAIGEGVTGEIG